MAQIPSISYSGYLSSNPETEDSLRPPKKLRIDTLAAIGANNNSGSNCEDDFSLKAVQTIEDDVTPKISVSLIHEEIWKEFCAMGNEMRVQKTLRYLVN